MKNWKTTLGGILLAIGLFLTGHPDIFPAATMIGGLLAPIGAFLTGATSRDSDVTSEASGAK
jgi:hypothetical protein